MRMLLGLAAPSSVITGGNGKPCREHRAPTREIGVLLDARAAFLGPIRELSSGEQPLRDMWFVAFLAISALVLPSFAMVLSVFKPWGRVRR